MALVPVSRSQRITTTHHDDVAVERLDLDRKGATPNVEVPAINPSALIRALSQIPLVSALTPTHAFRATAHFDRARRHAFGPPALIQAPARKRGKTRARRPLTTSAAEGP